MKGCSYEIRKPKNARSIQNIAEPSKEVLGFKVCSKMFSHLPWEVITTKGALDTKDYHCEIKNSKRANSKTWLFQTKVHSKGADPKTAL